MGSRQHGIQHWREAKEFHNNLYAEAYRAVVTEGSKRMNGSQKIDVCLKQTKTPIDYLTSSD